MICPRISSPFRPLSKLTQLPWRPLRPLREPFFSPQKCLASRRCGTAKLAKRGRSLLPIPFPHSLRPLPLNPQPIQPENALIALIYSDRPLRAAAPSDLSGLGSSTLIHYALSGFTRSIERFLTLSPCHLVTLSPCHLVTLSPCHLVTPPPFHGEPVEPSPCHPPPHAPKLASSNTPSFPKC
jgi:hypothetical protein